jgi:Phage tail tube protein
VSGYGIGAGGIMGVAFETTVGTYVAPTKFIPFLSETLEFKEANNYRRPIRQSAAQIGVVAGDFDIEGTITMEATEDTCLYFAETSRALGVKSGTTPNFTYTYNPTSVAIPPRTLSITIVRDGVVFGYTGCTAVKQTYSVNNNLLQYDVDIIGLNEATQTAPGAATWPTSVPYGPGCWTVSIPNGTPVFDLDTFSFEIDDAGQANYRLKAARGAQFINFGERSVQMTASRDFMDKTDYGLFQSVAGQKITVVASNGANNSIQFDIFNAIKDVYQVPLSGQGDLVRASITYQSVLDSSGNEYDVIFKTQEVITPHT